MKINKSFIRIALAVGLVGLAACSGSSSSSGRQKNSTLENGAICYTDIERAGLIENAEPRLQQDAVKAQAAVDAQPAVIGQPEVKGQAGVPAQLAPFEIPAVADQPAVPFQAAVPDQPEVPARAAWWRFDQTGGPMPADWVWMANNGYAKWVDDHHIQANGYNWSFTLFDATPMRPAVKGTPEVPHQDAVPGHRAFHKGEEITVAIPEIIGQPEVKAQAAVAAQPEILAREEVKAATKDEVIAEINAVQSCTPTTVASAPTPSPTTALNYEAGTGSEKIAKLTFTPDAADKEEYSVVVKQNGINGDAVSIKGVGEFTSAPLNPGCIDVGEFIVTRKSDDQLMAIIDFNYPDQDFTKCEPVIPENTVVNETTTTEAPTVGATTTEAPASTDAPTTTMAPVVDDTAKAAIVDSTATEVKLPVADVEVAVNMADLLKGFSVAASDVKSVDYQVSGGSWVPLTAGNSIKIPKAASKLSVRVTKTNGEEVVSEKAVVHTEASTDTTMAPADTTAPVTTEAPASSGSSSSNNTVLYILGFAIVAGAVVMFLKKKSASTK